MNRKHQDCESRYYINSNNLIEFNSLLFIYVPSQQPQGQLQTQQVQIYIST
jgi:hypothetical protein